MNNLEIKIIDFYYFSGTGNTLLVVRKMQEAFIENGVNVNLYRIENINPRNVNLSSTIGLAFPVAVQSTYPFIWDFIKGMPDANGTRVFMVSTLHSFSGAIVGPLKKVLNKKGYKTIGAKEVHMPANLYPLWIDEDKNRRRILKGMEKTKVYAEQLLSGRLGWGRVPFLSDILYFFVSRDIVWRQIAKWGQKFEINKDRCTKCGLCVRLCPVKNIELYDYPKYLDKCQQCLRCVMFCPTEAINMPVWRYKRYNAVKATDLLGIDYSD